MKFTIPSSLHIGHKTIEVAFDPALVFEEDKQGIASHRRNKIMIQKTGDNWTLSHDDQVETFIHEVMHFVLTLLEYDELAGDEAFVDRVSILLTQALLTSEGTAK